MKFNEYVVYFVTGEQEYVYGRGYAEAKIKAQARQIDKGNDFKIKSIRRIKE